MKSILAFCGVIFALAYGAAEEKTQQQDDITRPIEIPVTKYGYVKEQKPSSPILGTMLDGYLLLMEKTHEEVFTPYLAILNRMSTDPGFLSHFTRISQFPKTRLAVNNAIVKHHQQMTEHVNMFNYAITTQNPFRLFEETFTELSQYLVKRKKFISEKKYSLYSEPHVCEQYPDAVKLLVKKHAELFKVRLIGLKILALRLTPDHLKNQRSIHAQAEFQQALFGAVDKDSLYVPCADTILARDDVTIWIYMHVAEHYLAKDGKTDQDYLAQRYNEDHPSPDRCTNLIFTMFQVYWDNMKDHVHPIAALKEKLTKQPSHTVKS